MSVMLPVQMVIHPDLGVRSKDFTVENFLPGAWSWRSTVSLQKSMIIFNGWLRPTLHAKFVMSWQNRKNLVLLNVLI